MKTAANYFIGKYDFNSFRSIDCQSSSSIKTINSCNVNQFNDKITINVSAKSFLHSQVRIIVGTLVQVGKGKILESPLSAFLLSTILSQIKSLLFKSKSFIHKNKIPLGKN